MVRMNASMLVIGAMACATIFIILYMWVAGGDVTFVQERIRIVDSTVRTQPLPRKIIILDWSPAFFSRENKLPINATFGNCLVTRDKSLYENSHAIVIEVRNIPHLKDMPGTRSSWQRWIYFNIEPPYFAMLDYVGRYKMTDFKGQLAFNWTMTYRTDADVPMLHGWIVEKNETEKQLTNIETIFHNRNKLVAGMVSNCHYVTNGRGRYIKEMQKYAKVDVYGKCGTLECKGHYTKNACSKIQQYKFFLAFENSNCRDYISFKMWMQAFGNGAVPVVLGAYKEDYLKQIPPNSVIFADDFQSPKELTEYLNVLDKNESAYRKFHEWRKTYRIDYDYRFLGTYAWTKLCSVLNKRLDEPPKWHKVITDFENPETDCYQNAWVKDVCKNKVCT